MGKAEEAYEEARRRIAEAKREGAERLDLSLEGLERIPEEIGELTDLRELSLPGTDVDDLSAISGMNWLTELGLYRARVTDLSQISGLTGLTDLDLSMTGVTNLSAISEFKKLTTLLLHRTKATNISAIAGLVNLTYLELSGANVTDVTPISGLTALNYLGLSGTLVTDLTPLNPLKRLKTLDLSGTPVAQVFTIAQLGELEDLDLSFTAAGVSSLRDLTTTKRLLDHTAHDVELPWFTGLSFRDCAATREDARVRQISEINDPLERARALFEYLGVPVPAEDSQLYVEKGYVEEGYIDKGAADTPSLPNHASAPLETEIVEQRLVRSTSDGAALPPGAVDDRARKAWAVIAAQRDDLVGQIGLANYRPLAAAIAALSRALGPTYEAMNEIGVGIAGQRLAALVQDAVFMETLPDGAGAEVSVLATTLATFTNRFPEWLAYQEDATEGLPVAAMVQQEIAAFEALARALEAGADVDRDVAEEYRDELEWVRSAPDSEVAAHALLSSTRELLRTLAADMMMGLRLYSSGVADGVVGAGKLVGRRAAHEAKEFAKIAPTEIRKKAGWLVAGIAGDVLILKGGLMLALARQFPERLGWIESVLRFFRVI